MTTTVAQLISKLSRYDKNAKVVLLNVKCTPDSYVDSACEFNVTQKLTSSEKDELIEEMRDNNALNLIDENDVAEDNVVYLMFD